MPPESPTANRSQTLQRVTRAFDADQFDVVEVRTCGETALGVAAESRIATNYETGKRKRAYYVEGTGYEMGFLMGRLAAKDVERMTDTFLENVVPSFIKKDVSPQRFRLLKDLLGWVLIHHTRRSYRQHPEDIPKPLRREMEGLSDGCREEGVRVPYKRLLALNAGFDGLLAFVYRLLDLQRSLEAHGPDLEASLEHLPEVPLDFRTDLEARASDLEASDEHVTGLTLPAEHLRALAELEAEHLEMPIMCNAFSVFGDATRDGHHFFGRDFMFPSAGVFQDTACLVIYNPRSLGGQTSLPLVSVTAPGFVGSIAAMNARGIAMGVDMACSVLCNPARPGLPALMLVRRCVQHATSAQDALHTVIHAPRGTSWFFPVSDGAHDRAAVAETIMSVSEVDYLRMPPDDLLEHLPEGPFRQPENGVFVRWSDDAFPARYLEYNPALFQARGKVYDPVAFGPRAHFDTSWTGTNLPGSYYFAPERESRPDLLVLGNHYLVPELRLVAMHPWTDKLVGGTHGMDDLQWRYDELNARLLDAIGGGRASGEGIDRDTARDCIDFLAPDQGTDYYADNPKSSDGHTAVIDGAVSLFDLTGRRVTAHYGYYADPWVEISLDAYLDPA